MNWRSMSGCNASDSLRSSASGVERQLPVPANSNFQPNDVLAPATVGCSYAVWKRSLAMHGLESLSVLCRALLSLIAVHRMGRRPDFDCVHGVYDHRSGIDLQSRLAVVRVSRR